MMRQDERVESEGQNSVVLHIGFGEIPILSVINIIRWRGSEGGTDEEDLRFGWFHLVHAAVKRMPQGRRWWENGRALRREC